MVSIVSLALFLMADCTSTTESFRATIRSVRPLGERAVVAILVDVDPRFVVTMDVKGGKRRVYAIHSPTQTFVEDKIAGRTFDLRVDRTDCHGKVQFANLRRR